MQRPVSAALAIALPLSYLLWLSGAVSFPLALGGMLVLAFVVMGAGSLCLRAAGAGESPLAAAWVAGIFSSALAVYALVSLLHVRAAAGFFIWALSVLACRIAWRPRETVPVKLDARDLLGLALCAAATVAWCHEVAEVPQVLARERLLPAWIDYFIHGGVISQFGDPRAARQSIYLADFPIPFYHYASYMLPAAFAGALDLPGLPLATSMWLPVGFLTMCAGAYALGAALRGPAAGVAAVAALSLLPDPSNYGLRNGFLSFHWHVLALPGNTYAIGVILLAVALLQRWRDAGSPRLVAAALCLAAGSALFRVHLFAVGFPAVVAAAALQLRTVKAHRPLFVSAALVAFALFVAGFYAATDSVPALELFLPAIHELQEPTAYTGWYPALIETYGRAVAVPAGLLLMFVACLGIFAVLYPASVWIASRARALDAVGLAPLWMSVSYLLLMLAAPTMHWDSTELTVRPFVLVYAVVAAWTAASLAAWLAERFPSRAWLAMLLMSCVGLLLIWPQTGKLGLLPKFQWGWRFYPHQVQPGVPEAATFLRRASAPGDVLAVEGLPLSWAPTDLGIQLTSMSGVPSYLAYAAAQVADPGERRNAAVQRHGQLARVAQAPDRAAALAELRKLGISWYVVAGEHGPSWDSMRRHAAFTAGRIAVYGTREP